MTESVGEKLPICFAHLQERKEQAMSPPLGAPNWGIFLLAIPFLCALPVGILWLDTRLARHHSRHAIAPGMGRAIAQGRRIDDCGQEFFTDPDGRRWYPVRRAK
jgi:hypothetical protein